MAPPPSISTHARRIRCCRKCPMSGFAWRDCRSPKSTSTQRPASRRLTQRCVSWSRCPSLRGSCQTSRCRCSAWTDCRRRTRKRARRRSRCLTRRRSCWSSPRWLRWTRARCWPPTSQWWWATCSMGRRDCCATQSSSRTTRQSGGWTRTPIGRPCSPPSFPIRRQPAATLRPSAHASYHPRRLVALVARARAHRCPAVEGGARAFSTGSRVCSRDEYLAAGIASVGSVDRF
mmetsp:Transcript_37011/g.92121  ORF Transcript_37011/g.92121 Transcript_37011/m.92121 type:complete len:232 (-) Transcript_37011:124-819(-)